MEYNDNPFAGSFQVFTHDSLQLYCENEREVA